MHSTAHAQPGAPANGRGDELVRVTRALVSVSDKTGIVELARALAKRGIEIISTGGTAKALLDHDIPVMPIETLTGFPEMMGGRVKTLHPKVHGGILAKRDQREHLRSMLEHDIKPIDLVIVNLYPFEETTSRPGVTEPEAIEQIDIGGPSMVRSAAKNFKSVAVLTDPSQYESLTRELDAHEGRTTLALRRSLSAAAFCQTAAYDAMISQWMLGGEPDAPTTMAIALRKADDLRYGENPHQHAELYRIPGAPAGTLLDAEQLHGKPLSYNNINDASAALELVRSMSRVDPGGHCACVVKHTNPCGAAAAAAVAHAIDRAIAGDPMAAFGGILACSSPIDADGAQRITAEGTFFEIVIAPGFDKHALRLLRDRWKNLRILRVADTRGQPIPAITREMRFIPGGALVQDRDLALPHPATWNHEAGPTPGEEQLAAAAMLENICRALSSNAVLIGGIDPESDTGAVRLFGAGAGQMDRVAACAGAVAKAGTLARGAIAFSDAFFPFSDGPRVLIDAGVGMIVHPGGSKRDADTFELCAAHGITCMTTGVRHFRH